MDAEVGIAGGGQGVLGLKHHVGGGVKHVGVWVWEKMPIEWETQGLVLLGVMGV